MAPKEWLETKPPRKMVIFAFFFVFFFVPVDETTLSSEGTLAEEVGLKGL
jgi:hypothetical protein